MLLKMSELETDRLRLREFRETDLRGVSSWEGLAHAEKFLEFCFQSYREWGMGPWATLLKESETIAGNCGFCRISYERDGGALEYQGEVNYYVAPPYRGQGLATEALNAVLQFGFDHIKLTRIQARCSDENVSSERVILKAGLRFERMIADASADSAQQRLHAISREDFNQRTSSTRPNRPPASI
jgi:[ribosomal protein S5]-alanine N-acetyltransferase